MAPGKSTYEVLGVGQKGSSVETLQRLLIIHGYPCEPTGMFDYQTLTHVKAFQKANGLDAHGIVGESTWKALQKVE